jgi:hypothetical protein
MSINGLRVYKHILVAKLFVNNPDPAHKFIVDHKNHRRSDYWACNLQCVDWVENIGSTFLIISIMTLIQTAFITRLHITDNIEDWSIIVMRLEL